MKERLLYLRAEVDNFRKAANREIEELRRNGNVALLRSLVPVSRMLDSINHLAQNEKNERMAEGLDIISKQLSRVFEIFGMSITENLESSFGSEELSAE
jgi:molecular chaperone GrpE (heat shock protein)